MPYIETYYDYDLHRECFRVSDSASYVRTTDTILKLVSTTQTIINYFTATFSLDVIRNLGNGVVAIYDNEQLLQLVTFNENTSRITNLTLNLNYNVEHNIEARYLGNDECLSSKSLLIPILVEIPETFNTNLSFLNTPADGVIDNPPSNQTVTLELTDNDDEPISSATIKVYVDDNTTPVTLVTNSNGQCTLTGGVDWTADFGTHTFKAVYETTSAHFGVEAELTLYLGYNATLTPTLSKYIVGQTPSFAIETKRYNDSAISNMNVTLYRGD